MTTPPSSMPSPAPSSGSSQPAKPSTFSSIPIYQHNHASPSPADASPSAASQSVGAPGDGAPTPDASSEAAFLDSEHHNQAPGSAAPGFPGHSAAFLPQVTASPPPHAPPYVPPAQHAMAPDPIHTLSPLTPPTGSVWGPAWRPGPPSAGPGSAYGPPSAYPRGVPNGHPTHQLPPNPLEAYGAPGSRQSMTSTPGAGPIGPVNGIQGGRSNSQPGEPRDRRRDRHRDEEGRERDDEEVITTIFVVGFPDDMSEREFQNIFTFAPGFEAATLKFPSGTARREPAAAAALLVELQHLAANQGNVGGVPGQLMSPDHQDQAIDESFAAAMNFATQSSTASNTPSAAMSLTPSATTGATLGTTAIPSTIPPRRQTIGFARFKTRADALAARDHMQGRRIDPLTGATLKAEMAKKNLHTKRGAGGEDLVGLLLRSGRLTQLVTQQQAQVQAQALMSAGGLPPPTAGPHTGTAESAKAAWDAWPAPTPTNPEGKADKLVAPQTGGGSTNSNNSGSPPMSVKSPTARPTDSKALLALAEEADELEGWSVGSVGMAGMHLDYPASASSSGRPGPMSAGGALATTPSNMHGPQHPGLGGGGGGGGGFGGYNQHGYNGSGLGFTGGQDAAIDPRSLGIGNMNPADQNPPINTLYIGNLPAISPPTHPPNFLEESLRALFHRRPGFKRMSFRQKLNGPMCFVEFEDIPFATQAMRDLYGNTLNGLVKGGIRLSYSKNSLGQRGNSHQQGMNNSMFGGIAHTVALAGMSSAPANQFAAPGGGAPGSYNLAVTQPVPIGPPSNSGSASGRPSDAPASSLSPTAQPFNAPLPPTSPRSQRFYERAPGSSGAPGSGANVVQPQPQSALAAGKADPSSPFNSFNSTATTPGGGFSPVSSPIRTPASLGWVSSSTGNAATGTFGGFDAFAIPHHSLGSLNGAASAWGAATNSSTNTPS